MAVAELESSASAMAALGATEDKERSAGKDRRSVRRRRSWIHKLLGRGSSMTANFAGEAELPPADRGRKEENGGGVGF